MVVPFFNNPILIPCPLYEHNTNTYWNYPILIQFIDIFLSIRQPYLPNIHRLKIRLKIMEGLPGTSLFHQLYKIQFNHFPVFPSHTNRINIFIRLCKVCQITYNKIFIMAVRVSFFSQKSFFRPAL
jgi:hypothetical protein